MIPSDLNAKIEDFICSHGLTNFRDIFEQPTSIVKSALTKTQIDALFMCACYFGHFGFVSSLAECISPNAHEFTCCELNALHLAIVKGFASCVVEILSKSPGIPWLEIEYKGYLPLHLSIFFATPSVVFEIVNALKSSHGNIEDFRLHIDRRSTQSPKYSALHIAAMKNSHQVDTCLLENGADIDAALDKSQHTPLHIAALYKNEEKTEVLLQKGASLSAKIKNGMIAMQLVTSNVPNALHHILDKGISLRDSHDGQSLVLNFDILQKLPRDSRNNLLSCFVDFGQHHYLQHPLCRVLLQEIWNRLRKWYFCRLAISSTLLALVTIYYLAFHTTNGCTIER